MQQPEMVEAVDQLKQSLARSYAWETAAAEFYRSHRAELATKIRTGLVGLCSASALGTATLYGAITPKGLENAGIELGALLISFIAYVVGALMAGWALNAQYVDAIEAEGDASVRSMTTGRALDWVAKRDEPSITETALAQMQKVPLVRLKHDQLAITMHAISWGLWGTGSLTLAISVLWKLMGPWAVAQWGSLAAALHLT